MPSSTMNYQFALIKEVILGLNPNPESHLKSLFPGATSSISPVSVRIPVEANGTFKGINSVGYPVLIAVELLAQVAGVGWFLKLRRKENHVDKDLREEQFQVEMQLASSHFTGRIRRINALSSLLSYCPPYPTIS